MGLTPQYLDRVPESMERLYEGVEMDILRDIARRINTYDFFIPAAEHQYKMLQEMGLIQQEILMRLSDISEQSEETLQRLMTEAGATSLKADDVIHRRAGKKLSPLTASMPLQQTLRAGLANTNMRFTNLTRTTATMAAKQFGDVLDLAHMQIVTGAFDVDTAIRNSIKELSRQGVKAVQYASGRVETLEVAVRRATLTGVSQTVGKLQEARAIEAGCNLVEVTAHAGARPDHAEWQGKVYALEGKTEKYPNLGEATGYGTGAGLKGWNCRHDFFPFYEGISAPAYSNEMLEKYDAKTYEYQGKKMTEYEAVQHQRYLERGIRRWKREFVLADGAGIDSTEAASKLVVWKRAHADYLRKTGLKPDDGRTITAGFNRSMAGRAIAVDKRAVRIASEKSQYREYLRGLKKNEITLRKPHRELLAKVPAKGDWAIVRKKEVGLKDLAALTGETGHEFAAFTKGNRAIIVHGGGKTWNIPEDARKKIMDEKWIWEGHSHPTISVTLIASDSDIATLKKFTWQEKSSIIDLKGEIVVFSKDEAENLSAWYGIKKSRND